MLASCGIKKRTVTKIEGNFNMSVAKGYFCRSQLWLHCLSVVLNDERIFLHDMQEEKGVFLITYVALSFSACL